MINDSFVSDAVVLLVEAGAEPAFSIDLLNESEITYKVVPTLNALFDHLRSGQYKFPIILFDPTNPRDVVVKWLYEIHQNVDYRSLPILAMVSDEQLNEEQLLLDKGITHVLGASADVHVIKAVISFAVEEFRRVYEIQKELSDRSSAIGSIVAGKFRYQTRQQALNLATMLSMTCDETPLVALGLVELMINAVEHGCLEIGHEEKGRLIEEGRLTDEIRARRQKAEFVDRYVDVEFKKNGDLTEFTISDPGQGFDFLSYQSDFEAGMKKHGRGIMMARGCFADIKFHGTGSKVVAIHKAAAKE